MPSFEIQRNLSLFLFTYKYFEITHFLLKKKKKYRSKMFSQQSKILSFISHIFVLSYNFTCLACQEKKELLENTFLNILLL